MEIGNIIPHIEALIFASDKPLTSMEITELINNAFGFMEEKLTLEQIQTSLDGIIEKYSSDFYPFEVRESGGGWQFLTKKEYHKTVAQLNGEKFLKRLSAAALETLAIIAYKQPITKGEIEAIRGVSSDYSIQKLLEKELIIISGRNEEMVGKPLIYTTSKTFMDYFGINSPADLPKLKEIFAETLVEPTVVSLNAAHDHPTDQQPNESAEPAGQHREQSADHDHTAEESVPLSVSEQGELQEHVAADQQAGPAEQQAEESDEQADEGDAITPEAMTPTSDAITPDAPIPPYADDDLSSETDQNPEEQDHADQNPGESDEQEDSDENESETAGA